LSRGGSVRLSAIGKQQGIKTVFFSSNQGRKQAEGVKPDYIIYQFPEMRQAIEFFESL